MNKKEAIEKLVVMFAHCYDWHAYGQQHRYNVFVYQDWLKGQIDKRWRSSYVIGSAEAMEAGKRNIMNIMIDLVGNKLLIEKGLL